MTPAGLALAALSVCAGCSSNHHVSPFLEVDPSLLLRPAHDLGAQLARASEGASAQRLREAVRVEGKMAGDEPFVALGYDGTDAAGEAVHALRAVTPAAIVLALGPPRLAREGRSTPTRLLASLLPGGGFPSGADLTGDGAPVLAVRADDGTIALYRIEPLGATRYPVQLLAAPTLVMDVNGDGRPDLAGRPPVAEGDPLAPDLLDVAVLAGGAFRDDGPAAIAFHAKLRGAPAAAPSAPPGEQLRRALERAFHATRAGQAPAEAFQPAADLAARLAPLPPALAASWVTWRGWMADHAAFPAPID